MSTAVAPIKANIPSLVMDEAELISVLSSSIYPGAKAESIKLAIGYCRAAGLDPLQKPVHIVPMDVKTGKKDANGKDVYEKRDTVMPGVGLYRIQAARSGEYVGMTEPEFGPDKTMKLGKDDNRTDYTFPEWCRVTVRRKVGGMVVEFTAVEYWLENYATAGRWTTEPNAMWKKRPRGQLAKCTEAQALRKAFPELGAAPTADELEGKTIDSEGVIIEPSIEPARVVVQMPQARQIPAAAEAAPTGSDASAAAAPATEATKSVGTLKPSQVNIIRSKLGAAGFTEADLGAQFPGKSLEPKEGFAQFAFEDFNAIVGWIAERAQG